MVEIFEHQNLHENSQENTQRPVIHINATVSFRRQRSIFPAFVAAAFLLALVFITVSCFESNETFSTKVSLLESDDIGLGIADGILESARRKYAAMKRLEIKRNNPAKRTQPNNQQKSVNREHEKEKKVIDAMLKSKSGHKSLVANLEAAIAGHKLSTRGLVEAVKEAQKAQIKRLGEGLEHQTDDLIVAKIKELKQSGVDNSVGSSQYVLNNALTPAERKELAAARQRSQFGGPARSGKRVAAVTSSPPNMSKLDQFGMEGSIPGGPPGGPGGPPGGPGGPPGGSQTGNPENMLSSYDRQLLASGPSGVESSIQSAASTPSLPAPSASPPMASTRFSQPTYQPPTAYQPAEYPPAAYPAAPAYSNMQPPYQALATGYPGANPFPPAAATPNYAQNDMAASYPSSPQYARPQYPGWGSGAAVPAAYGSVAPVYGSAAPAAYAYAPQYGYAGYPQQALPYMPAIAQPAQYPPADYPMAQTYPAMAQPYAYARGYQPAYTAAAPMASAPYAPPQPAAPVMQAQPQPAQLAASSPGSRTTAGASTPVLLQRPIVPTQNLASAAQDSPSGADDTLWKMFTAPSSDFDTIPTAQAVASSPSSASNDDGSADGSLNEGTSESALADDQSDTGSNGLGSASNADALAAIDPHSVLPKGVGTDSGTGVSVIGMAPSMKSSIRAKMEALRRSIESDFHSTLQLGRQAGYLPPPP